MSRRDSYIHLGKDVEEGEIVDDYHKHQKDCMHRRINKRRYYSLNSDSDASSKYDSSSSESFDGIDMDYLQFLRYKAQIRQSRKKKSNLHEALHHHYRKVSRSPSRDRHRYVSRSQSRHRHRHVSRSPSRHRHQHVSRSPSRDRHRKVSQNHLRWDKPSPIDTGKYVERPISSHLTEYGQKDGNGFNQMRMSVCVFFYVNKNNKYVMGSRYPVRIGKEYHFYAVENPGRFEERLVTDIYIIDGTRLKVMFYEYVFANSGANVPHYYVFDIDTNERVYNVHMNDAILIPV